LKRNEKFYTIRQIYFNIIIEINGKKTKDARQVMERSFFLMMSEFAGVIPGVLWRPSGRISEL
jgi:hypothetical protein